MHVARSCLSLILFAAGWNSAAAQPQYTPVSLGTLGSSSAGYAINNFGEVTGVVNVNISAILRTHVFYSTGAAGDMTDLDRGSTSTSIGLAINDSGVIVGTKIFGSEQHGILEAGGGIIDLGRFGGVAGTNASAYGINAAGQISGTYVPAGFGGTNRIMRYENGVTTNGGALSVTGQHAYGYGINASGQIAATRSLAGVESPYLWTKNGSANISFVALGNLGGTNGQAYGLNDSGMVVGASQIAGNGAYHAFRSTGAANQMTDLGTLGGTNSYAFAINNAGQVVGNSQTAGNAATQAFLHTGGALYNLNQLVSVSSGVTNISFSAAPNTSPDQSPTRHINDWGQIAATGTIDGARRAIVLNPVTPLTGLENLGASRNTKFVAGMDYSLATATTNPTGLHTTMTLLGGVAGANRDVDFGFTGANHGGLASDIVSVAGTDLDTFVLQLSYDPVLAATLFGSEANAWLGSFDSTSGAWVPAVFGNNGGTSVFVLGAFDGDATLGHYGVNTLDHTVWAVLDHNGDFGVAGFSAIPEPSTYAALAGAAVLGLAGWRRRRANAGASVGT